jgi:hypothetical protein
MLCVSIGRYQYVVEELPLHMVTSQVHESGMRPPPCSI